MSKKLVYDRGCSLGFRVWGVYEGDSHVGKVQVKITLRVREGPTGSRTK